MSSYLLSSAYLFPKGAPTKHTDQAWFRRPEDSQFNLDLLEREEALYATAISAIRNVSGDPVLNGLSISIQNKKD
jgi:hypothetical protein